MDSAAEDVEPVVEPVELASPPPRRNVGALVAGAVGVLAVSALAAVFVIGSGGGDDLERLPSLAASKNQAGGERAMAAADSAAVAPAFYGYGGWLPSKPTIKAGVTAPATSATAYEAKVDDATISALAKAVGVTGTPRAVQGGTVMGEPARLAVAPDGTFTVGDGVEQVLNPDPNGVSCAMASPSGAAIPCAPLGAPGTRSSDPSTSSGGGSAGSTGSAGASGSSPGSSGTASAPDLPPEVTAPSTGSGPATTIPCGKPTGDEFVPAVCVNPVPSPPDGTRPAAEATGRAVLAAIGATGTVEVFPAGERWSVALQPTAAAGLPGVTGNELLGFGGGYLEVTPDGSVVQGGGRLLTTSSVGSYPLLGLQAAVDGWWEATQNGPQPLVGKAEPAIATDTPLVAPGFDPAATPSTGAGSCCGSGTATGGGSAAGGGSDPGSVEPGPAIDLPAPVPVPTGPPVVDAVRISLQGAGQGEAFRFVPVYVLHVGEYGDITIPAVTPEHTAG